MPFYRVSLPTHIEDEFKSENEAILAFLDLIRTGDIYGNTVYDLLEVEVFNEETKEWE